MKGLIIGLLTALIILVSCYAYKQNGEARKLRNDRETIEKLVYAEARIITRYVDKHGMNQALAVVAKEVASEEINAVTDNTSDSDALSIYLLKRQVNDLIKISTGVRAENLASAFKIDSLSRRVYFYQDRYLKLSYRPPMDTIDKGTFDFNYDADLTVNQYQKRNGFLGAKKNFIDIYSNDPRTTVNGVKRLSIERASYPKFRLQSSFVYNIDFKTLSPGITGRFEVKRLSVSGSYFYSPARLQWYSAVGLNYDLIRF